MNHSLLRLIGLLAAMPFGPAVAGPLDGQRYIIDLSYYQNGSGYSDALVPSVISALNRSGMRPAKGPGADVAVNILTRSDVGKWVGDGAQRVWLYEISITVGISPESFSIPITGTPAFGVEARLLTPNPDREDELTCLVGIATRTAVALYQPTGHVLVNGQSCARQ